MSIGVRLALTVTAALHLSACDTTARKPPAAPDVGSGTRAGSPIAAPVESAPSPVTPSTVKEVPMPTHDPMPTSPPGAPAGQPHPEIRPSPFQPPAEVDPPHKDPGDEVPR